MTVLSSIFGHPSNSARSGVYYAIAFSFLLGQIGCVSTGIDPQNTPASSPRDVLRVATSGDYAPFSKWPADESQPTGFSVEIARAYAEDRGADLRWIRFRWLELADDLAGGAFDLALSGITIRPDRSMRGRFSLPLTTSGATLLVRAASAFESSADLDQPTIRLAVNAGGHLERVAKRLFPRSKIESVADNAGVLERLIDGRADAVLTDDLESPHWQRIAGIPLRAIGPLTRDRKAAFFPAGNTAELQDFDRWLLRTESSGRLGALRAQFGLPEGRMADPLPALLSSLDERLSLMIAVADAKHTLGLPTENAEREELVLDAAIRGLREAAEAAAVADPPLVAVRRLFRAQMNAARWIQDQRRNQLESSTSQPALANHEDARIELEQVIRPALIDLGRRISMLIIACVENSLCAPDSSAVAAALERHRLPSEIVHEIDRALSLIVRRKSGSLQEPPPTGIRSQSTRSISGTIQ